MDSPKRQRAFLNVFFFLSGFCFSTWASRIPTIKTFFGFNEAELGTILLFMPISSLVSLPISGWLVSRYDSRVPLVAAFCALSVALSCIGFSTTKIGLIVSLCFMAFTMRLVNISVNTQALHLQKVFNRNINGSFHGLWSTGGIAGVSFTTLLLTLDVGIANHLLMVSVVILLATVYCYRFLLRNDKAPAGNKLMLAKPDPFIVYLGVLVFLASICEGGMFDWSGIFFKEVVKQEIFTLGYLNFMVFMALSRFACDRIVERMGMEKTFNMSAAFIFIGIGLAVVFPSFWPSMIGFCLVGFGSAAVIPMTYSLAATSRKYSPGMAISIIATYGIAGAFLGPPLIGYLAQAFGLKNAFIAFAIAGILLVPMSQRFFRYQREIKHA
ncbi:MFS transporter [Chryseolinea lacunae]|uniref:MFS transporter n=1 Tax=Chryseolinea lacunae TaxID=2801331 RepID=A0ABS1KRL7_9BACT|nr:MFS transporter [Chryseolinea lacunae]MBL0741953.1 MFS transporter [Chryseolinea lacunae]